MRVCPPWRASPPISGSKACVCPITHASSLSVASVVLRHVQCAEREEATQFSAPSTPLHCRPVTSYQTASKNVMFHFPLLTACMHVCQASFLIRGEERRMLPVMPWSVEDSGYRYRHDLNEQAEPEVLPGHLGLT